MSRFFFKRARTQTYLGNKPTVCREGHKHPSKFEASVCEILFLQLKAGALSLVETQVTTYLTLAKIGMRVDFRVTSPDGKIIWVEAKGCPNDTWPLKKKLWSVYGPGPLHIWTGSARKPEVEILTPKNLKDLTSCR